MTTNHLSLGSFKDIPHTARVAFEALLVGDSTPLTNVIEQKNTVSEINPYLAEIYFTDFSTEWNKLLAKHFLDTKILLNTGSLVPKYPSIWLNEWILKINQNFSKFNFNEKFDFRKFPADEFTFQVEELKVIFSHIFKDTKKDHDTCKSAKNTLISYGHYFQENNENHNKDNTIIGVYTCAMISFFKKALSKNEDLRRPIIFLFYLLYGKQKESNKDLFTPYITSKTSMEKIVKFKDKQLEFRDNDSKYWRFFLSFIPEEQLLNAFKAVFDLSGFHKTTNSTSIAENAFKRNQYYILNEDIPVKKDNQFINKKVKI